MSTIKEVEKYIAHVQPPLLVEGGQDELYQRTTISELPDDVLLDIFEFYVDKRRPFAIFF